MTSTPVDSSSIRARIETKSRQYTANIRDTQWPIVYSPEYNLAFCGLERLHPFDSAKWGKIFANLKAAGMIREDTIVEPDEVTEEELLVVHTKQYLAELRWSMNVANITELPPLALMPNFIVQRKVLRPFRYQTSGTIMAGRLAVERGWAINIGGGFHHCSAQRGGGFCAYADISLCVKFAFDKIEGIAKIMIVDLDAHQGNGHERDFMNDPRVYIVDIYNRSIYPHDGFAKRAISKKVELVPYTEDQIYLMNVRRHLESSLNEFEPDLVVYNAGSDILAGDLLGCLSISPQGLIERDQIVFQKCRTRGIPVMMVTSGGYQHSSARVVSDSILNLHNLRLISCDEAEHAPLPELGRSKIPETTGTLPHSRSDGGLFARFRRSCLSRASSSTNSISSLNTAGEAGAGQIEASGEHAAKSLSTDQLDNMACVSPFKSAFEDVELQSNDLIDDGQREENRPRPVFNINTPVGPVDGAVKDARSQALRDPKKISLNSASHPQPCFSESLPFQEESRSELDHSTSKKQMENVCKNESEPVMNLYEALSALRQDGHSVEVKQKEGSCVEHVLPHRQTDSENYLCDGESSKTAAQGLEDLATDFTVTVSMAGRNTSTLEML